MPIFLIRLTSEMDRDEREEGRFLVSCADKKEAEALADKLEECERMGGGMCTYSTDVSMVKSVFTAEEFRKKLDKELNNKRKKLGKVKSYPSEYAIKPIDEQVHRLSAMFDLDGTNALEYAKKLPRVPRGAEGWFAIPRWQALAPTYLEATKKVLEKIGETRTFDSADFKKWCLRKSTWNGLVEECLYQHGESAIALNKACNKQKGDIILLPAQFGSRHPYSSVLVVRNEFSKNEFGLGMVSVGSMLLTHPERLTGGGYGDKAVYISCPGDDISVVERGPRWGAAAFSAKGGEKIGLTIWMYESTFGDSVSGFML